MLKIKHYTKSDLNQIALSLNLNTKDKNLLSFFLEKQCPIKSQEIIDFSSNINSRQQVVRDLKKLIDTRLINKEGKGPSTRYSLNYNIISKIYIALNYLKRSPTRYDSSRIESYTPNTDYYLTQETRDEFMALSTSTIQKGETINDKIFKRLLIDFSWVSSKMEGNTYSLLETTELIEKNITAKSKTAEETQMIKNHAEGVKYITNNNKNITLRSVEIRSLHSILSKNLLPNPMNNGNIRNQIIDIGQSKYIPEHNPIILKQQLDLMCETAEKINNPFEQSFFLLINIPYLQPFIDINKRTGRLSSNIPLLKNNLCPNSFYGINEKHYLSGLLEFYETGQTQILQQTLLESYILSVKQYQQALNAVYDTEEHLYHNLKKELIKDWINNVINNNNDINKTGQQYLTQWVKKNIGNKTLQKTLIIELNNMDEFDVLSSGVSIRDYQKFISIKDD